MPPPRAPWIRRLWTWLLVGRSHSGKWVLPERHGIPYWLLWQLNGNKNRRANFYAISVDYNIVIGGYSLHIIVYILNVPIFFRKIAPVNVYHLCT